MRAIRILPLVVLFVACAGGAFYGSAGDADKSAAVVGTSGRNMASTEDFDVSIVQAETPMMMYGQPDVDIKFDITVLNRTKEPCTVKRIALQSIGGVSFEVPVTTREFKKVIAPGQKAKFGYWARAYVTDATSRQPVTMRALLETVSASGQERSEEYTARLNGRFQVQLDRGSQPRH
jgi:hypothetical protein